MRCFCLLTALLFSAGAFGANPPPQDSDRSLPNADTVKAVATQIDQLIAAKLTAAQVTPTPLADDAEFLRRVYLDLTGRIPSVAQARRFLNDSTPGKRERLIDSLLESGAYVQHFTNVWRSVLLPDSVAATDNAGLRTGFEIWLRQRLGENMPYNQMVRAIVQPGGPRGFYQANENKPENLAASTSRLFLGVKLECAQCHNDKFARWTREQFWSLAAFFPPAAQRGRPAPVSPVREIKIPGTEKVVKARFLDSQEPQWIDGVDPRVLLADWITAPENPFFARAAVNRIWAHLFGIGLVDPVDDLSDQNPASHPELLNELARQFTAHEYDLKFLIRAIAYTQAYQRTSLSGQAGEEDPRSFARRSVKGLSGEQLYESLAQATGLPESVGPASARAALLTRFASPFGKPTEFHLSILQALSLMNGKLIADVTDLDRSETLAAVLDAPFMDTRRRIETLYLAALTREPRPEEATRLLKYVESQGADGGQRQALADVFWALLNSGEFILNH
jgi:hypothetical protein